MILVNPSPSHFFEFDIPRHIALFYQLSFEKNVNVAESVQEAIDNNNTWFQRYHPSHDETSFNTTITTSSGGGSTSSGSHLSIGPARRMSFTEAKSLSLSPKRSRTNIRSINKSKNSNSIDDSETADLHSIPCRLSPMERKISTLSSSRRVSLNTSNNCVSSVENNYPSRKRKVVTTHDLSQETQDIKKGKKSKTETSQVRVKSSISKSARLPRKPSLKEIKEWEHISCKLYASLGKEDRETVDDIIIAKRGLTYY